MAIRTFIRIRIGWNFSYLGRNLISLFPPSKFSFFHKGCDVFLWDRRNSLYFSLGISWKNRRIFFRYLIKDIQSIKLELKEGIYTRRVLYLEIRGQGAIP
ncbi:Photosystem I assembly protein Ycf4 [Bienertia sinuspersici]